MTDFGGSRPIQARWNYVQSEEPTDRRDGVRWIDTSGDDHVTRVFTSVYDDWMRETRVWVANTEPTPRIGPLDGDRWIDASQENRPTLVYSTAVNDWVTAISDSTKANSPEHGGWHTQSNNYRTASPGTRTRSWSLPSEHFYVYDEYSFTWGRITDNDGNLTLNYLRLLIDGTEVYRVEPGAITQGNNDLYSDSGMIDGGAQDITLEWEVYNSDSNFQGAYDVYLEGFVPEVHAHTHPI